MVPAFSPYSIVPESLATRLRACSNEAEELSTLTDGQLSIIYAEGWFKMFVPERLGGLGLSLSEGLRLEETLAWIDGSLGWTVTLCSGATMFVGYMDPEVSARLLGDPRVCFGGSGQASGIASVADEGYKIDGSWRYATGAPHLTVFTANCRIQQQTVSGREPQIRSFFFMPDEVAVREDWNTIGLKATAGHAFEVKDMIVPASRSFIIDAGSATIDEPLYRYPFLQFAEATLAVNTLGMAQHFVDLCSILFEQRTSSNRYTPEIVNILDDALTSAQQSLGHLRADFYSAVQTSWQELINDNAISTGVVLSVSETSRALARGAREAVQNLYPYCGMAGADPRTELNRVWRDLFTASQHSLLVYPGLH